MAAPRACGRERPGWRVSAALQDTLVTSHAGDKKQISLVALVASPLLRRILPGEGLGRRRRGRGTLHGAVARAAVTEVVLVPVPGGPAGGLSRPCVPYSAPLPLLPPASLPGGCYVTAVYRQGLRRSINWPITLKAIDEEEPYLPLSSPSAEAVFPSPRDTPSGNSLRCIISIIIVMILFSVFPLFPHFQKWF